MLVAMTHKGKKRKKERRRRIKRKKEIRGKWYKTHNIC
jgi:hypothetical protein